MPNALGSASKTAIYSAWVFGPVTNAHVHRRPIPVPSDPPAAATAEIPPAAAVLDINTRMVGKSPNRNRRARNGLHPLPMPLPPGAGDGTNGRALPRSDDMACNRSRLMCHAKKDTVSMTNFSFSVKSRLRGVVIFLIQVQNFPDCMCKGQVDLGIGAAAGGLCPIFSQPAKRARHHGAPSPPRRRRHHLRRRRGKYSHATTLCCVMGAYV